MFSLTLLIVLMFINSSSSELFSSTEDLEALAMKHQDFVNELRNFADELEQSLEYIRRKVKFYEREEKMINKDVESYVSIPINAFALIKMFTNDSLIIKHDIRNSIDKFSDKIERLSSTSSHDLQSAVVGIARLQDVFKFKTEEFVNGVIDGDDYNTTLSVHDLFIIGTEFLKLSKFSKAVEYLDECLKKSKASNGFDIDVTQVRIMFALMEAHERNENFANAETVLDKIANLGTENHEMIEEKRKVLQMKQRKKELKAPKASIKSNKKLNTELNYNLTVKICNDEIRISEAIRSKLRCRYISNSLFSKLAPFKLEEAYLDPLIVLYHDVINDNEIDFLKNLAKPVLRDSIVYGANGNQSKNVDTRISKVAWFKDSVHPAIAKLSKRVEEMTGLTTTTAEDFQIQRYGIAGFYRSHYDFVGAKSTFIHGDRVGTVLFYLNDVEKGGATVFPYIKVRLTTRKGSAAFWHNLHSSGAKDYRTRHSGCPILIGSKWVANKWIHERGQERRRPCDMINMKTDELFLLRNLQRLNSNDVK